MEDMSNTFPKSISFEWSKQLQKLNIKVSLASNPCLNIQDVLLIEELATQLIHAHADTEKQLEQFWSLYNEAYTILQSHPKTGYAPQGIIDDELDRIRHGDKLAEKLVLEADRSTFAFPLALLLAHVVRTETISHAIEKQLCDVIEKFENLGLTKFNKNDTEFMCSVHNTFFKGNKQVRSDVKVIRNSIAHALFSIRKVVDSYEIEFNNSAFQFYKVYSMKEFGQFFDLHTMLYKRQLALFFIIELIPILTTHFLEKPSAS